MENPLNEPIPVDPVERVHALARDLAYGAVNKLWSNTIIAVYDGGKLNEQIAVLWGEINDLLGEKWKDGHPSLDLLSAFGYLDTGNSYSGQQNFELNQKAYSLLDRPVIPPTVFISYSRKTSSTFGLLIECRLKAVGVKAFIDRSLDPGEEWHRQLEETVSKCSRFIVLLAKGTLASSYVSEEIAWARTLNILTIPIWQPGFDPNEAAHSAEIRDFVVSKHSIRILEESAESYYNATESLLNRLGYSAT